MDADFEVAHDPYGSKSPLELEFTEEAAEPDTIGPEDVEDEPDGSDDDAPPEVYQGRCVGGPYAGRTVTSRFPKGFLLVDRPTARAWLYDTTGDTFVCRGNGGKAPMTLDTAARWRAAEEPYYDVIVYEFEEVSA